MSTKAYELERAGLFLHAKPSDLVLCVEDQCGVVFRVGPEACPVCGSAVLVNLGGVLEAQTRTVEALRGEVDSLLQSMSDWRDGRDFQVDAHLGAVEA